MKKKSLTNIKGDVRELLRLDIRTMHPAKDILSKKLLDMLPKKSVVVADHKKHQKSSYS